MADINPMIPMSMNYGTSPFIQATDMRKSLAAADAANLNTAIEVEKQKKYNTAQSIIKKHMKEGILDPVGATRELYEYSPDMADQFVKDHAEHMLSVHKGLVSEGNIRDYPEAQRYKYNQQAQEGYGPYKDIYSQSPMIEAPAPEPQQTVPEPQQQVPMGDVVAEEPTVQGQSPETPEAAYYRGAPPPSTSLEQMQDQTLQQMQERPELSNTLSAEDQSLYGGVAPSNGATLGDMVTNGGLPEDAVAAADKEMLRRRFLYAASPTRESMTQAEPALKTDANAENIYKMLHSSATLRAGQTDPAEFQPGGSAFDAIRKSIQAGIPMQKIMSDFNRSDKTLALSTYMSPEMYDATGIDVARQVNEKDFKYAFGQTQASTEGRQGVTNEVSAVQDLTKTATSAQGVVGTQLKKMDNAMHARNAIARSAVLKGGKVEYHMNKALYTDLITSLAAMLGSSGQGSEGQRQDLAINTLMQDLTEIFQYVSSHPGATVPTEVIKYTKDLIDGQGGVAEDIANGALQQKKDNWLPMLNGYDAQGKHGGAARRFEETDFGQSYRNYSVTMDDLERKGGNTLVPITTRRFTMEERQSLKWAHENPTDPRATEIYRHLGMIK